MSIAQAVKSKVMAMPTGQVFGYRELPDYTRAPNAVVKAVNRLVSDRRLVRLSKGKFYVPKKGMLGPRKPSDSELLRSVLYKDGNLRGYVTGMALYNRLGLTTQMPRTVTIALNGGRQEKDYGTIRVRTIIARAPVAERDVKYLQYLDVLKDIKKIPDTDINQSLKVMKRYIAGLSKTERKRLAQLGEDYYSAQVRALLGLLLPDPGSMVIAELKRSLNPTTTYKLNLDLNMWPAAREWNIQ
jgi:hypothetical protein